MWEEDPRWQEANYRFSIVIVIVATVSVAIWSVWESDWAFLGYWMLICSVILCALLCYGGAVWLVCHSVAFVVRFIRRKLHRGGRKG